VICGGESGAGARPMHPDWARSLRDQCIAARVPFHFKQWGEWQNGSDREAGGSIVLRDGRVGTSPEDLGFTPDRDREWNQLRPAMMAKVGKARAGRLLEGRTWDEFPAQVVAHA
jgi:protein gp37